MMSSSPIPSVVLVVGRGLYALQLIRAYDAAGCKKVFLATSADLDFARASLSLSRSFLVPKPDSQDDASIRAFSSEIQRLAFELEVDLIVPAAEEGMFVSLLAPSWHANGCQAAVLACPFALMDELHDKYRFQKLCESKGIATPKTLLAKDAQEVIKHAEAIGKETKCSRVVVKPVYTRGGRTMWALDLPLTASALNGLPAITAGNPFVVQQFVSGQEFSSYTVVSQARMLAHVCYKCDFPIKGFSTVRSTVRKPAILDWVYRFIQELEPRFSGQLGFDFIETYDGNIFALECNPRATNGVSFFACDRALARGLAEAQYAAGRHLSNIVAIPALDEPVASPSARAPLPSSPSSVPGRPSSPEASAPPAIPRSPSSVFTASVVLGDDVLEPRSEIVVATMLPALSLLKGNPKLFRTLKIAYADMEWPSDPFPLGVALLKSARLLSRSVPKLIKGERFADLAAKATEEELVKYNTKPSRSFLNVVSPVKQPVITLQKSSSSSLSSWDNEFVESLGSLRVLVTGATGFLGSHLVLKLAESSQVTVIATGRNRKTFESILASSSPSTPRDNIEFVPCDLSDRSAVKSLVKAVDVIVHCAAKCSPWGHMDDFMRDNVEVTQFLLEASVSPESSVTRFIHVSSPSVAFAVDEPGARMFARESDPLPPGDKQANMYSHTKMLAEKLVTEFAQKHKDKLCVCSVRPRAIYGEGDRALFPRIVSRLRESRLPQIGDGNTVVDLTHVSNVVHALILAIKCPKETCNGQVYNITDCDPQKLWRIVDRICDTLEMPRPRIKIPRKVAFTLAHAMETVFGWLLTLGITEKEPLLTRYAVNVLSLSQTLDCSLAREHLGYQPILSTEEGIKGFLDSIKNDEVRLPLKKTHPTLALIALPFARGLAVMLVAALLVALVLPSMNGWLYYLALICFGAAQFLQARASGSMLLKEEARRRRVRSQLAIQASGQGGALSSETGEYVPEKGKRQRPWRSSALVDVDQKFAEAVRAAPSLAVNDATKHLLLDLYGLFKQQKDGDCNIPAPSVVMKPRDFAKWKAWNDRKGVAVSEARTKYIEVIEEGFDLIDDSVDPEKDREQDMLYAKQKERVQYRTRIEGVGRYLPKRIVSSQEVEKLCAVEDGWSTKHNVGVRNRRWADYKDKETNSFMAAKAIEEACEMAGIRPHDLDLIINASASNERILPDGSCLIKRALGLESSSAACFSLHATCLSFVVAMDIAGSLIESGRYKRVAIVSSEVSSVACDFSQPESALLLGDGAAACILGSAPKGSKSCIHRAHFENFCKGLEAATLRTGTLKHPKDDHTSSKDHLFDMNGPQIVEAIREVGVDFLEKVRPGLSSRLPYDYDLVVPHQPSGTAMDMLVAHGWPREQTISIIGELGNCVAASTAMALYEAVKSGRLQRGNKFIMCGTGGGITLGAVVLTY